MSNSKPEILKLVVQASYSFQIIFFIISTYKHRFRGQKSLFWVESLAHIISVTLRQVH